MKRVTITDVANRAGVSKSTVSHVINQTRFVELDTRLKVLKAIDDLEYRPSAIARSLVYNRTKTAGLMISDVANPFYHEVIMAVEEVALANDYSIFLCNTSYDLERGMKLIQSLVDKSVDGILFMSSSLAIEMVQEAAKNQIKAVVLDWGITQVEEMAATITINFHNGIDQAVQHLVDLGHTQIAHVSGPLNLWTACVRRDAFLAALARHNLDPDCALVIPGNLRIEGGYWAFETLIKCKPRPTAVLAANDLTALGMLWAARSYGLKIPQDLSIIGLDDIDLASKVTPSLSTIALPRYQIGELAMRTLLEMINNSSIPYHRQEVGTHLVLRESTARVNSLSK